MVSWITQIFKKDISEQEQKAREEHIDLLKQMILKREAIVKDYRELDFLVDARPNIRLPENQSKGKGMDFLITE